MNALILRAARRFYVRHPGQLMLALLGVALGVAVVVAVDVANQSAARAFTLSNELSVGRTTHQLLPAAGLLDESVYRKLRVELGIPSAAPVIERRIRLREAPDRPLTLLGVDPLAERGFRTYAAAGAGAGGEIIALLTEPGTVLLPSRLAAALDAAPGDTLTLLREDTAVPLRIVGLADLEAAAGAAAANLLITDMATAQELLGLTGYLSRIDLVLDEPTAGRLAQALPPGTTLTTAAAGSQTTAEMLRAFRINLTALSLLALAVGALLIYATMSFAIVQRRQSLARLRAVGATRGEVLASVLAEALVLGTVATLLGLALGWLLSSTLVRLVLRTVQDLYFTTSVAAADPGLWPFAKGALLGIGATVLAALRPALEAASTAPRAAMTRAALERATRERLWLGPALALPCLLLAAACLAWTNGGLLAAFAGLFLVLAGAAALMPAATLGLLALVQPLAARGFGLPGALAVRGAAASLSRTGVAVMALAVAVATVIGIGVMIASFRASVSDWLDRSLLADFYVTAEPGAAGTGGRLAPADLETLRALPGVAGLSLARTLRARTPRGDITLRAGSPGPRGWGEDLVGGDSVAAFAALSAGEAILVSEPLARRWRLAPGDTLTLPTVRGPQPLEIAGVYRDYRTDGGAVLLSFALLERYWDDARPSGVGIYLDRPGDEPAVGAALERFVAARPALAMLSNRAIRERSLLIFDRTFAVTGVLRTLAGLIAFTGILSALLALQLERGREVATLRALGFTPAQVRTNALAQTMLLGATAGVLAMPLGVTLAALLIYVINVRSYGWSMGFVIEAGQLSAGVLLALVAAFLAGLYPARRLARQSVAGNLRAE